MVVVVQVPEIDLTWLTWLGASPARFYTGGSSRFVLDCRICGQAALLEQLRVSVDYVSTMPRYPAQ